MIESKSLTVRVLFLFSASFGLVCVLFFFWFLNCILFLSHKHGLSNVACVPAADCVQQDRCLQGGCTLVEDNAGCSDTCGLFSTWHIIRLNAASRFGLHDILLYNMLFWWPGAVLVIVYATAWCLAASL